MKRWVLAIGCFGALAGTGLAQEVRPSARKPQIWAIVAGIDDYTDPAIPDSKSCVHDAVEVLKWFLNISDLGRDHVLFLANLGSRHPGDVEKPRPIILPEKVNLDWAFQKWLPSKAHSGDLVVVYFAGRVGVTDGPEGGYYLLPVDAIRDNVAVTGWSLDRALDRFVSNTRGKCQIACLLATTVEGGRFSGKDWLGRLARWPGATAWLASDHPLEEFAREEPSARFTRDLLDGLGTAPRKPNLSACLQVMQKDPELRRQGFQTIGGVPPRMTLWPDQFGQPAVAPRPEMMLQVGHADTVTDVVVAADGQRAVTASMDSTLRVWSLKERALLRVLSGHEVGATALGLSADGRWLVSGGGRPTNAVLVHDLDHDYRQVIQDQPHTRAVAQVAMLPDGFHFVTIDHGARAVLWNLKDTPPEPRHWPDKAPAGLSKAAAPVNCLEVACGGDPMNGKVAALCDDRSVRVYNSSGTGQRILKDWPGRPTTIAIDSLGRWLAVGLDDGRVVVRDFSSGRWTETQVVSGPVTHLAFSSRGLLAVGHGRGLSILMAPDPDAPASKVPGGLSLMDQPPGKLTFSRDGTYLAVATRDIGGLKVWNVGDGEPRPIGGDDQAGASAMAFTGDGRTLIAGGFRGTVEVRPLDDLRVDPAWSFTANRAKIQHLGASPSRRFLLMINDLGHAQIWDLKERTCRRLSGSWTSGTFAARDDRLVLTELADATHSGRVVDVRLVGEKVVADPTFFQPPGDGNASSALMGVVLSADGSRIAATAGPAQAPLVCVWEMKTGRLIQWITHPNLADPVRGLSFSSEARYLLTAGDSPEAKLWDLAAGPGEPQAPAVTFRDADPDARNVTACLIRPGESHQVITGHRNGLVRLWNWRDGQDTPVGAPLDLAVSHFIGEVKALTVATDGTDQYLAAAGDGTSLWIARMAGPRPTPIANRGTHHFEQINALAAWPIDPAGGGPTSPTLISGSDDTTVKLWDLKDRALVLRGTFSAAGSHHEDDAPAPGAAADLDWVVFTPDGHFDASAKGRDLIRFRLGDQARSMDQFDDTTLYTFDLGERLLSGKPAEAVARLVEPPPISIEPTAAINPDRPDARVTITLGAPDLKDVRLYHNNIPVGTGLEVAADTDQAAHPGRINVPVRLVKGSNRFYAMATAPDQEGSFDSRSSELDLVYDGPKEPGKLHIVAIGVGDYSRRRLKFADRDAERIADVLHERGLDGAGRGAGMRILLTNSHVSNAGVTGAFTDLAKAVKGRPQDTVVVFLAGHTGVLEAQQFCLLLPSYPFPADTPTVVASRDAVVSRDAVGGKFHSSDVLRYAVIEANLMRLDALNRLVIVDACQSESIFDDAQVKEIRRWMEVRSRRARNSYLMAARRGEPALEVEGLRHGLFTYTLLRGMGGGAIDLDSESDEITQLSLRPNADFNNDGMISTGELETYARSTLPALAQLFPHLMTRSRDEAAKQKPDLPPIRERDLEQDLRMQTTNVSFPLVPLTGTR